MSPAMSALQSVGITNAILILGVLFAVAAGVIGMFWHYILPGAIIIGVLCLFAPPVTETPATAKVEVPTKVVEKLEFNERQAYMKDCMEVAEYPMAKCAALWEGREHEEPAPPVTKTKVDKVDTSELQLLDVDNVEYKARRDDALQKPGAVIGHVTYR